ncbi:cation channel sperm-associated auxiliary subunit beta-like [Heteronotia binoei]|uniref:cation channel sperm-associated auxiliary subunit beta-like n=1 Tax=Heteronotia binoei TaxID=13085 RepID=UPI00292E33E0|nr:cation channel sperm-associated auxiliary subunit beta-like [Heteronotia binoei]
MCGARDILAESQFRHGRHQFCSLGREPIVQWALADIVEIGELLPNIINIKVSKSPCAGDVAVLGFLFDDDVNDCSDLALLDVMLTNTRLVLLTTLGLFISEDLRYGSLYMLKFSKPNFCGFERDDYYKAKIWYNVQCLANQENYELDYISLTFNKDKTLSQESTCFYSYDPFKQWHSCLPRKKKAERFISQRAVSFLVDYQQNTGIGFLTQQEEHADELHDGQQPVHEDEHHVLYMRMSIM